MRYLIFNTDQQFHDTNGEPCSFEQHLRDVYKWYDTPDMWTSTDDIAEAIEECKDKTFHTAVVDAHNGYEIVHRQPPDIMPMAITKETIQFYPTDAISITGMNRCKIYGHRYVWSSDNICYVRV